MVADLAHDVRTDDVPEAELLARVAIMRMAEPGDQVMGRLIARYGAVAAADQARRGVLAAEFVSEEINRARAAGRPPALDRLAASWAARYADPVRDLAEGREQGARLVVPGDPEWPTQLDDLGDRRPYGLWLHGTVNLRFACLRSVAIVGARAATAYGVQVASELASGLGDRRWTVISGGAYGIDAAAHRGALASGMPTVVVLACGTDVCYPTAHQDLFQVVRSQGVVVSEVTMGSRPTRPRFLVRNRLIAALSRGTVVVQAAVRSGALNTATHANELNRHLMAVPGPITVEVSEGCHDLIRQGRAVCVTSVQEITELVGAIGGDLALVRRGPAHPRDALNDETRRVLEAVPTRVGTGPAAIAVSAGVDLSTTLSCLGALAVAGFVEHGDRGWRLRHEPDG
ncbi:DNA-processing protein DprA [Microtetraspora malaysiensis]|uniref:DNA-processing protein DprA n=1 Tax=Microtetraspora malaysiensis TaxID=161358 RepID=UPI000A0025C8|nr:DNA-processing protein DprA [Microtetraspora malaysiensis]